MYRRAGVTIARAIVMIAVAAAACDSGPPPAAAAPVKLWHGFNRQETEALNEALAGRDRDDVEVTMIPFPRGLTILRRVFEDGESCPDVVRIDASWLPALAEAGLLSPVPERFGVELLPEAAELARHGDTAFGLPQSLDGLALIHRRGAIAGVTWPPTTVDELEHAAAALSGGGGDSIGVRVDGYWFAAFLRARGGDVLDPFTGALGIDRPVAAETLTRFAAMFGPGGVAPPPPPPGDEERDEVRRFRAGSVVVAINGPWALHGLGGGAVDDLAVVPFPPDPSGRPAAPRGGQLFVVPRCARQPAAAWQLAAELTSPALQAEWSRRFGVVPTTAAGLADGSDLSRQFYHALQRARPLPRHPTTPEMFDDLTPAIAAVVRGDATASEALAGVERAWHRLLARSRRVRD